MKCKCTIATLALAFAATAAAQTAVPHDFQAGTPARAAEVNENFDVLEQAIDVNAADIQETRTLARLSPEARQIQTALDLTSGLRWLVSDYYLHSGGYPANVDAVGAGPPAIWSNRFVASSDIENGGIIRILFDSEAAPQIANRTVILTPNDPGSGVVWFDCAGDGMTDVYLAELDCAFPEPPYMPFYAVRRQIETMHDLLDQSDAQQLIRDFYITNGAWPADNAQAGLSAASAYQNLYISRLDVAANGTIVLTFGGSHANSRIRGSTLSWTPQDNGASIQWNCSSADIAGFYMPFECRN
jgi:type IV pilus assembly protein PilA